jgi:peptide/nickel transport system permease protein
MLQFTLRRLVSLVPVIIGASIIIFMLVHLAPGDPVRMMLGEDAEQSEVERLNAIYGFDRPKPVQYVLWLGKAVTGDFGQSLRQRAPVTTLVWERMGATLELAVASLLLAVIIGVPLGILAATHRNTWLDFSSMVISLLGVSLPNFWLGLMLLSGVALHVSWLPIFGRGPSFPEALTQLVTTGSFQGLWDSLRYLLLPALALGTSIMALVTRLMRSSLLEVLNRDYVRTAQAKGLAARAVIYKHALRNALLPVITVVGVQCGSLLGGAVVTEAVFAWPGIGRLIVQAISARDFPVVQGSLLMLTLIFVLVNLLVDLSYGLLNPRVRYD